MERPIIENQELMTTLVTVIGGIITSAIGAYVAIRLGQNASSGRSEKTKGRRHPE
ncbi:MAG: hypothetical protein K0R39_29 [Symbiobacteriaceae bacterium]|jgi:uncharacterized membrane protein YfcA|nr:hypothetical protein [Symbiobacteriaceae bacterium]